MQIAATYAVREHNCELSGIYNRDGYSVKQKNDYMQQECIWCRYGNMKYKNIQHAEVYKELVQMKKGDPSVRPAIRPPHSIVYMQISSYYSRRNAWNQTA